MDIEQIGHPRLLEMCAARRIAGALAQDIDTEWSRDVSSRLLVMENMLSIYYDDYEISVETFGVSWADVSENGKCLSTVYFGPYGGTPTRNDLEMFQLSESLFLCYKFPEM